MMQKGLQASMEKKKKGRTAELSTARHQDVSRRSGDGEIDAEQVQIKWL